MKFPNIKEIIVSPSHRKKVNTFIAKSTEKDEKDRE